MNTALDKASDALPQDVCFDRSILLGELVALHPAAAQVLKDYRIDFCCGGNRPLFEVLAEHGLSENEVTERLMPVCRQASRGEEEADWTKRPYSELIDHIVQTHHGYLYRTLPQLAQYVLKIEQVHGGHHPELTMIRKLFAVMNKELMIHLPKEEMEMFPAIKKLEREPSLETMKECWDMVGGLEDEHESCGRILKQIRGVTNDYTLPDDACATYHLTFQLLQELEDDLFRHIHLENNILFPRVMKKSA